MKVSFLGTIATLAFVGLVSINPAHAEEKGSTDQAAHQEHHPDNKANLAKEGTPIANGEMMGMMHDCMKMHKDHKVCHQENIKTCEAKMEKKECAKMMKNMKHMKMDNK